jgi:predicted PurR-regulated permease PerM
MKRDYFLISLFFLISAVIFYLFYQLIVPFFVPICWATVLTIIFFPLQERLARRIRHPNLLALLMCTLIIVLIIGPITYLFVAIVYEAAGAVAKVNEWYNTGQLNELFDFDIPLLNTAKEKLAPYYDISKINLDEFVKDAINKVSGAVVNQTTWLVANGTKSVFYFGLMIFSMFYFFRDGEKMVAQGRRLLPLTPSQIETAFTQLREVIQATMYGGLAIALLQGLLGGILFAFLGIPSAVFWGAIMAFLALIPLVGAFIVYIPAGIILILGGSIVKGIVVISFGILVSQVDNIVRPLLISGRASMHPLLLFFAILGGISLFGLLGLVVGPMVAASFIILLKIFEMRLHPEEEPAIETES